MNPPNIIMILLDGARWDRIETSTEFTDLMKIGTTLNNVNTAIPYTIGSVNATFSGLYGKDNGIDAYYKMFRLKDSVKILPEILQEAGYFTACDLLSERIITKRGFDIHQFHDEYSDDLRQRHPEFLKACKEKSNGKPLFVFLHFTRIHTITVSEILKKYEWNDEKFYQRKEENLKNYDKVFLEAGSYSKLIKNSIDSLDLKNDTIIIFFSDHGTGVGERFGERNYGSFTFEETIRSFYLFIGKGIIENRINSSLRETIDIFPTILDFVGIDKNSLPGESVYDFLLENKHLENKTKVFSETGALQGPYPSPKEPNIFCIKNSEYKLIFNKTIREWQLYNLKEDPAEKRNIFENKPQGTEKLQEQLISWIERD
ncbi:MAG: sulfatase-like hydrolase/transferase [Nitrosopumilus sp.]|nr:sulfatase-like hydrolase/transferase [Nitrosopumilus sp.]